MSHPFPLQPEEHIVLMARKHWFVLLRDSVGLMFAAFLPLIAGSVLLTWAVCVPPWSSSASSIEPTHRCRITRRAAHWAALFLLRLDWPRLPAYNCSGTREVSI
jgi:hypothetical protein